ncbi:PP2C family protein-serine/threonine phosphatase [Prosthecobacter fluviatilis]
MTPALSPTLAASLAAFAPDASGQSVWMEFMDTLSLAPGEVLFRKGDTADAMFLIESGTLAVVLEVEGAGRAELRRLGPGQFLGEMALYRSEPRTASVEAVSAVKLWRLTAARLREAERLHPQLAVALHRHVASLISERVVFSNMELKQPLARLAHALRGLATSDFSSTGWDRAGVVKEARRSDEVGAVAQAMEFLADRLQEHITALQQQTAAREAIESELRIAGEIQSSLLPPPLTTAEQQRVDFASFIKPAREAGGDLYDGFFLPDGRFFTLVGDVSGKGVPAAVFMALAAMAVRTLARELRDPGELLAHVNRLLCERNETMQFVTACAVFFDPATGALSWANAGHPLAAVISDTGSLVWLDGPRAAPLGVFEETAYATQHHTLAPRETLLVYSDGVSEAQDPKDVLFGSAGIQQCLAGGAVSGSAQIVQSVVSAVLTHQAEAPQADDITLVALRRVL